MRCWQPQLRSSLRSLVIIPSKKCLTPTSPPTTRSSRVACKPFPFLLDTPLRNTSQNPDILHTGVPAAQHSNTKSGRRARAHTLPHERPCSTRSPEQRLHADTAHGRGRQDLSEAGGPREAQGLEGKPDARAAGFAFQTDQRRTSCRASVYPKRLDFGGQSGRTASVDGGLLSTRVKVPRGL
jgi:hypothetical protein